MKDIVIIGGGPAGLTASIYAQRAGLETTIIEKLFVGGQAIITYEIENYPGFIKTSGPELMSNIESHAASLGCKIINEEVIGVELEGEVKVVKTANGEYKAKTVIICTGARPRLLDIKGEKEFTGRGVSYCATCDGAFYRNKEVAVIGGGNTAVEDALFLARTSTKVHLIHRRERFRAERKLVQGLSETGNIELHLNSLAVEITGKDNIDGLIIKNRLNNEDKQVNVDGIFVAVGVVPNSSLFADILARDANGNIITNEKMATSLTGVYAAGDVRNTPLRQILTAASDGAVAAYAAAVYIAEEF